MQDRPPNEASRGSQPGDGAADLVTVRAALAGSTVARHRVVELLGDLPAMMRVKNARLGSRLQQHELDDATQSVLLSLWQKLDRFDGRVPLLHWAYGFGVIEMHRIVERRARRREQTCLVEPEAPAAPAAVARAEQASALLARGLAELDPPERDIVLLKHFEGLTFEAAAARLGLVVNTAKTRYYRALERLRARLRPLQAGED
ncbi:MAG TPA: sigma-70 family RNA polymerase sigma factor [Planctomycetota bacterium]|nr:sigma-70 family RNA polymerase sigma factor [Planctomycetota bacterium]